MANILLLNLSIIKFYNKDKDIKKTYNPPLGLLYISSSLSLAGHNVKVIDYCKIPFSRKLLFDEIDNFKPILVGISVYTENVDKAFKICKGIKKKYPDVNTVLGGPQASLEPIYTVSNPYVDFVLKFEGESTFLELVESLDSNQKILRTDQIYSIAIKKSDSKVLNSMVRKDICDLDLLPFPLRTKADIKDYGTILNIVTSRGCPGRCIYCSATALSGAKYRTRSIINTYLEIVYMLNLFSNKENIIYILDDTFTAITSRVVEFTDLIQRFNCSFKWRCESRVDVITEEITKKLASSNCIGIAFGVESGSQHVLDKIHKNIVLEQAENVVNLMYKYNIYTSLNFMLGHYCDTYESMEKTYNYIKYIFSKYHVGIFATFNTPFPGTWQQVNMEKIGLKTIVSSRSEYSVLTPSVEGKNFTVKDQVEIYNKIIPFMVENNFGLKR